VGEVGAFGRVTGWPRALGEGSFCHVETLSGGTGQGRRLESARVGGVRVRAGPSLAVKASEGYRNGLHLQP